MTEINILIKQLEREKKARKSAEAIAESKSLELYQSNLKLQDLLKCNTVQYKVARILSESTTFHHATIQILDEICKQMQFTFGAIWIVNMDTNKLCCLRTYPEQDEELADFIAVTKNTQFTIEEGLPGRVWQKGEVCWINDIAKDDNFPRKLVGKKINLHSACAFPIYADNVLLGVMEFFMQSIYPYKNHLIDMLDNLRQQISLFIEKKQMSEKVEAARYAGMAEVTSSILHNVGNILNSINTSVQWLLESGRKSYLEEKLLKISTLINSHESDLANFLTAHQNGKIIPNYLTSLSSLFTEKNKMEVKELEFLSKNVNHVVEIISTQQVLSASTALVERVSIPEKIDESINLIGFDGSFIIEKKYKLNELILLDKVKLMQILINLIRNAKDILLETDNLEKRIKVSVECTSNSIIKIKVKDNGIGISNHVAEKIFTFGFTTKKKGHGIGLHSSGLLAKEMGGTLKAKNNKKSKGATFILELPYVK